MSDIRVLPFLLLVSLVPLGAAMERQNGASLKKNNIVLKVDQKKELIEAIVWKIKNEAADRTTYFINGKAWINEPSKKLYDTLAMLQEGLYQVKDAQAKQALLTTFCNLIEIPTINIQEVLKDNSDIQNHK